MIWLLKEDVQDNPRWHQSVMVVCPRWAPTQITQCAACARLTIMRANQPSCTTQTTHPVAHELAPLDLGDGTRGVVSEQR